MSDLLHPKLPFRLDARPAESVRRQRVSSATLERDGRRRDAWQQAYGNRIDEVRAHAAAIKDHALAHLDHYLEMFVNEAERAGATVHYARDADEARRIVRGIAERNSCTSCVKSKSMVTEEIALLPALEEDGIEVLETDLGEFVVQLDQDAPSHIVTPIIHRDRAEVGRTFEREIGAPYEEDPERLTKIARDYMRTRYARADLGITGANFLVAETGSVIVCTNEGNADLTMTLPKTQIAITGIEKVLPTFVHLSVFLKLLARSGTGQPITVYTTSVTGAQADVDQHIVLLDNGRSKLLGSSVTRELLRCIRCGACLNTCPVFRTVGGGHAYGAVYSGPIGAVLTPHLAGPENYVDLPRVSSLCGACESACPVKIDIPKHLALLRETHLERGLTPAATRRIAKVWAWAIRSPKRYDWLVRHARVPLRVAPMGGWSRERGKLPLAKQSFRAWWKASRGG